MPAWRLPRLCRGGGPLFAFSNVTGKKKARQAYHLPCEGIRANRQNQTETLSGLLDDEVEALEEEVPVAAPSCANSCCSEA